jgi:hypothetical protein
MNGFYSRALWATPFLAGLSGCCGSYTHTHAHTHGAKRLPLHDFTFVSVCVCVYVWALCVSNEVCVGQGQPCTVCLLLG